jgi:hypothetical protein
MKSLLALIFVSPLLFAPNDDTSGSKESKQEREYIGDYLYKSKEEFAGFLKRERERLYRDGYVFGETKYTGEEMRAIQEHNDKWYAIKSKGGEPKECMMFDPTDDNCLRGLRDRWKRPQDSNAARGLVGLDEMRRRQENRPTVTEKVLRLFGWTTT